MDLKATCPGCGQHIAFTDSDRGQMASCPTCGKPVLLVPLIHPSPVTNVSKLHQIPAQGAPDSGFGKVVFVCVLILAFFGGAIKDGVSTKCKATRASGAGSTAYSLKGANQVRGQVFVTLTKGGVVKFAGVEVLLLDKAATDEQLTLAQNHLIEKDSTETFEYIKQRGSERAKERQALAQAEEDLSEARIALKNAQKNLIVYDALTQTKEVVPFVKKILSLEAVVSSKRQALERAEAADRRLDPSSPRTDTEKRQIEQHDDIRRMRFLFSRPWRGLVTQTSTDADGYFSLTVPASGSFYVVSSGVAQVGAGQQSCYWLTPIQGGHTGDFFLNNATAKIAD